LGQVIQETAYHRNVCRHSVESCISLVWISVNKLSFFTKTSR